MSLTYGFYNSINEDRKYNASQMSKLFDGVLNDGIFMAIGDKLMVSANTGMNVSVGTGRAWFDHTWTLNDSILVLPVAASELLLNRIDVVVLEVNNTEAVRANSIKIVKGTGATVPVAPALVNTSEIHQYPLAHIYVGVGVTEIIAENITNKVGTSETPFATGVMQTMSIDALVAQWQGEWDNWSSVQQADYMEWFNNINALLGTEPATNLQLQVSAHDVRLVDLEYDARIAYIAEKIRNRNLVENGDFSNGTTGWTLVTSTGAVANNIYTFTPTATHGRIQKTGIKTENGSKYYFAATVKATKSTVCLFAEQGFVYLETKHSSSGNFERLSNIYTGNSTGSIGLIQIRDFGASNFAQVDVQKVMFIVLTTLFGAGNEPTKAEMDAAIDLLGGWTDVPIENKYLTGYNLGANINALTSKTTPVDADMLPLSDSAATNGSKKVTWANIKATIKTYFDTLYGVKPTNDAEAGLNELLAGNGNGTSTFKPVGGLIYGFTSKTTPIDADSLVLSDSAASNGTKKLTWANIKATLKTYFDGLYALAAHTHNYLPLTGGVLGDILRIEKNTGAPDYSTGQLELRSYDGSAASMGFHRIGSTACQLRHEGSGLILSGASRVAAADFYTYGNITAAGNITAYSDERLKSNIETIPNALDKVLALRGVEFDKGGVHSIGVIAQEVQKVIPEVVMEHSDEMKTLSVAYGNLVGLLIEAIKEQQTQIDELKAKVH